MLLGIEVARPQAEADGGLGAALGADHAGGSAARALAQRGRLEQDDALEPGHAGGTTRTTRRWSRHRPRRRRRTPVIPECCSRRRRWHRLNSQSIPPAVRPQGDPMHRLAEARPRRSRRPPGPSPTSSSPTRSRSSWPTGRLPPELPSGAIATGRSSSGCSRRTSPTEYGGRGLHDAAAGARAGAGRPGHQRAGLGAWARRRPGCPRSRRRTSASGGSSPRSAATAVECYAITEEHAGSDVADLAATARRDGDDYVLDGEKWHVTSYNEATYAFFQARLVGGEHAGEHAMFFVDLPCPGRPRRAHAGVHATPSGTSTRSSRSRACACRQPT